MPGMGDWSGFVLPRTPHSAGRGGGGVSVLAEEAAIVSEILEKVALKSPEIAFHTFKFVISSQDFYKSS